MLHICISHKRPNNLLIRLHFSYFYLALFFFLCLHSNTNHKTPKPSIAYHKQYTVYIHFCVVFCILYSCSLDACIMQDTIAFPFRFPHAMPVKIEPWKSTSFLLHYFIMRVSPRRWRNVCATSQVSRASTLGQMCFCKCVKIRRLVSCGCAGKYLSVFVFPWLVFSVDDCCPWQGKSEDVDKVLLLVIEWWNRWITMALMVYFQ